MRKKNCIKWLGLVIPPDILCEGREKKIIKYYHLSHDVVTLGCKSQRFDCVLLVFIRRWGWLVMQNLIKHDAPLWLVGFQQLWLVHVPVGCSFSGLLFCSSPVFVFLDRGHPCFWNFNSTIPVDVVRVKSYVNCLFDPVCVPMWIMINKLYLPKWIVSGVVSLLWNGGGLVTG